MHFQPMTTVLPLSRRAKSVTVRRADGFVNQKNTEIGSLTASLHYSGVVESVSLVYIYPIHI
jgi:hypothetical protein